MALIQMLLIATIVIFVRSAYRHVRYNTQKTVSQFAFAIFMLIIATSIAIATL